MKKKILSLFVILPIFACAQRLPDDIAKIIRKRCDSVDVFTTIIRSKKLNIYFPKEISDIIIVYCNYKSYKSNILLYNCFVNLKKISIGNNQETYEIDISKISSEELRLRKLEIMMKLIEYENMGFTLSRQLDIDSDYNLLVMELYRIRLGKLTLPSAGWDIIKEPIYNNVYFIECFTYYDEMEKKNKSLFKVILFDIKVNNKLLYVKYILFGSLIKQLTCRTFETIEEAINYYPEMLSDEEGDTWMNRCFHNLLLNFQNQLTRGQIKNYSNNATVEQVISNFISLE